MKTKLLLASLFLGAFLTSQAQIIYSNDFSATTGMSVIDGDGDGQQWTLYNSSVISIAWGLEGGFAVSKSWDSTLDLALTPNNFLITPAVTIPETFGTTTLSFVAGASDTSFFAEQFSVYLAPTTATTAAAIEALTPVFNITLAAGNARTTLPQSVDVSAYAGQTVRIIIRHHDCTNMNLLYFDTLAITQAPLATTSFVDSLFKVYPNPATNVINVSGKNNTAITAISLTDLNGRTVKQTSFDNISKAQLNISDLSAGVYMMNISSKEGTSIKKIIKN